MMVQRRDGTPDVTLQRHCR